MYIFIFNHTILNVSNLEDLKVWKYKKHPNSKMRVSRISKKLNYNFEIFISCRNVEHCGCFKLLILDKLILL